ncbi:ScbR family autoregulator-binding transcription factor [Streptomyces sp. NPDC003697]
MQERARRTRDTLITAASTSFTTRGYQRTSVRDILRTAGTTRGAFYFHFASKEDIAGHILSLEETVWADLAEQTRGHDASGLQQLIDFTHTAFCRILSDPVTSAGVRLRLGDLDTAGNTPGDGGFVLLTEFLDTAWRQEELRPGIGPQTAMRFLTELFVGAHFLTRAEQHPARFKERLAGLWGTALPALTERPEELRVTAPPWLSCDAAAV